MTVLCCFGAACSKGVQAHFRPCTAADVQVTLAVNQYVTFDPAVDSGCVVFPATSAVAAEYLLVPQLTAGIPGQSTGFRLVGDTILPAPAPAAPAVAKAPLAEAGAAAAFHDFLRLGDEERSWGFAPEAGPGIPRPRASPTGPPAMGTLRTFRVCAKTDCSRFDPVGARVRAVSNKVVIFVDTLAPAGGLDSAALADIATLFDQQLYPVDTAAFGRESDIDGNGVVMVLMTNTVNKLVTKAQCNTGFVAGFFFGADLDPQFQNDSRSNKGEIFYSIVADPAGSLSCSHPVSDVQRFVPVTFIHEFQHMISFNQHVLMRGGTGGEVLWLNEGMSHYAEELGGRSLLAAPDGRVNDCQRTTVECFYFGGDLIDAYEYMDSVTKHFLLPTAGIGSLAERGAAWMFVRYVVDQYAAGGTMTDWNALTRSIDGTALTGAENIASVTGDPFDTVVTRWALSIYVTDRGGIPPELQYKSWDYHTVFASLHTQRSDLFPNVYPLAPLLFSGRDINLGGTLHAGSGIYVRASQPADDPGFTISFTAPKGAPISAAMGPRLTVMRLQ